MGAGYRRFVSNNYEQPFFYDIYDGQTSWQPKIRYFTEESNNIVDGQGNTWIPVSSKKFENQIYWHLQNTSKNQWKFPGDLNKWTKPLLRWVDNSCYTDSVLQCLFYLPNHFTDNILHFSLRNDKDRTCNHRVRTKIQKELNKITNTIRGKSRGAVHNVRALRSMFRQCKRQGENFDGGEMRDAGDFLGYLLEMFPIADTKVEKEVKYYLNAENKVSNTSTRQFSTSVMVQINLHVAKKDNLELFLSTVDDTGILDEPTSEGYYRVITQTEIESSPYLVFQANRNDSMDGMINNKKIHLTEEIKLHDKQLFLCVGVVVYVGAHFVCVFRDEYNIWWYYNDHPTPSIEKIGSFSQMLLWKGEIVKKQGTLYFYMEKK